MNLRYLAAFSKVPDNKMDSDPFQRARKDVATMIAEETEGLEA
jgi:hypothetical protein